MADGPERGDPPGGEVRSIREVKRLLRPPSFTQQQLGILADLAVRMGLAEDPAGLSEVVRRGTAALTAHEDMKDEDLDGPWYGQLGEDNQLAVGEDGMPGPERLRYTWEESAIPDVDL